jgi:mono/diheme cytochrome c family protein
MTVTPAGAEVGTPTKLTVELKAADGARVTKLAIVHEKPLHMIVVSKGLAEFAHIHPAPQPDGTLVVEHTFPAPGTYLVFGDFTPEGGQQSVARATIEVQGTAPAPVALAPAKLPTQAKQGAYTVKLSSEAPLAVGDVVLSFGIAKDGKAVTDLQPYLGARGHCVIISEDGEHYLHSHPLSDKTDDVQFHTELTTPGVYKLWAEFRPNGEPLLVSFVINVPAAPIASGDPPDAGPHVDGHDHGTPIDAGAKPTPIDAAPAAAPDAAPKGGGGTKISAAEQKSWTKAKTAFDEHCADCHTAGGEHTSARKLAKFDMSNYPFVGKKATAADMRKVLGLDGGKATMPKGKVGSVPDDELALIRAWADAYDAAH